MLFTTSTKLLLLTRVCGTYTIPNEIRHIICEYAFMTYDEAVSRVVNQRLDVTQVIDSALSRKNGYGGLQMDNTMYQHWIFGCIEYVYDHGSDSMTTCVTEFEAQNCRTCGNYIPIVKLSGEVSHSPAHRVVCTCDAFYI
jgi:hypothetical protein